MIQRQAGLAIIKLGGSLLDLVDLPATLDRWLTTQATGRNIILVGGGAAADNVRRADGQDRLDPAAAHRLAIEAMAFNTRRLRDAWRPLPLVTGPPESRVRGVQDSAYLLDVGRFLDHIEPTLPGERLPASWNVTSDSIAARLAEIWRADELVLLKSSLPPDGHSPLQWRDSGYVDRFFPTTAALLPLIRCVDLRDDRFPSRVCRPRRSA